MKAQLYTTVAPEALHFGIQRCASALLALSCGETCGQVSIGHRSPPSVKGPDHKSQCSRRMSSTCAQVRRLSLQSHFFLIMNATCAVFLILSSLSLTTKRDDLLFGLLDMKKDLCRHVLTHQLMC